uniref:O-fucosyltransferase family protein n=1 Tax=Lactuca sativa TaxID=4236 RepID=A0A9R1VSZ7_LACSA|nr:hypothetical protein LSAT_V11C400186220 [Lactuca sativa]
MLDLKHFPRHQFHSQRHLLLFVSRVSYLKMKIVLLLKHYKVLYFTHNDSRIANNGIPNFIQKLRLCVNYNALKYFAPFEQLEKNLVARMIQNGIPYLALHLRHLESCPNTLFTFINLKTIKFS